MILNLKNKSLHIDRLFATVMLWVFAIALTPWAALHQHKQVNESVEKHCTHKFHVKTSKDNCLICSAHFEKHYVFTESIFTTYLHSKVVFKHKLLISGAYAQLISTALRGPPSFS